MRTVKLFEVCDISSGGTPSRNNPEYFIGDIPWAKISDIENADNGIVHKTEEHISALGLENIRGKMFPAGTLLFAMYGSIGKVGITGIALSTNQAILGIRPRRNDEVNLNYLKSWFESNRQWLINQGRGVALKNLSATIVRDLEISLPPLDDQVRIAHVLGKVEGLIAQRKKNLKQLEALLKSVFLGIFGDPVSNEKGWDQVSLKDYGTFKNGLNFGRSEVGHKVRYLGVGDFKDRAILNDFSTLDFIDLDTLPTSEYFLSNDDLLFVRSNGNKELVGRCMAVYPEYENVVYSGFCIRFRIQNPRIKSTFIAHLFRSASFRKTILQGGQGANIQNINQQILSDLLIPLPPLELQFHFEKIIKEIEITKFEYQKSLTDLQALYSTLSQQAFKGKLDLSRIPLDSNSPIDTSFATPLLQPTHVLPSIKLPNSPLLSQALKAREKLQPLLRLWLNTYRDQLGRANFSADRFLSAAQVRLTEVHPDQDFNLGSIGYEHLKDWVFESLAVGTLMQDLDKVRNRIQIKATRS